MPEFTFGVPRHHRGASEPSHAGVDANMNPGTAKIYVDFVWDLGVVCFV